MESPIVLVHGLWNTHRYLRCLAKGLRKKGFQVFDDFDLVPNNGKERMEVLATQLSDYVQHKVGKDQPFHLVGFSMGGLVSRYYFQYLADRPRVKSLVTVATPNNGTWRAHSLNRIGFLQMCPESRFLQKLNADLTVLEQTRFTSIWAKYDTIILPNKSARLPVGREVVLPFGVHAYLPFTKRVLEEVEKAIQLNPVLK